MAEWPGFGTACLKDESEDSVRESLTGMQVSRRGLPCPEGGAVATVDLKTLAAGLGPNPTTKHYLWKNCLVFYMPSEGPIFMARSVPGIFNLVQSVIEGCISEEGTLLLPNDLSHLAACIHNSRSTLGVAVVPESAIDFLGCGKLFLSAFLVRDGEVFMHRHRFQLWERMTDLTLRSVGQLRILVVALPMPQNP